MKSSTSKRSKNNLALTINSTVDTIYGKAKVQATMPDGTDGHLYGFSISSKEMDWKAFIRDYPDRKEPGTTIWELVFFIAPASIVVGREDG